MFIIHGHFVLKFRSRMYVGRIFNYSIDSDFRSFENDLMHDQFSVCGQNIDVITVALSERHKTISINGNLKNQRFKNLFMP
jgi:hypothetical protein